MVQPWADDEPIPEPEEMDPDEERELYQDWYDLKEIEAEIAKGLREVLLDIGGRDDPE
jgi:hypothetical protein